MASEATRLAMPHAPFGLVAMATLRTPAGGSSLRPGEARNAHPFQLLLQIARIAAIRPLAHALIVLLAGGAPANAVRVANKNLTNFGRHTELDDGRRAFVRQVADPSFNSPAVLVPGPRQLLPASAALRAARLQAREFTVQFVLAALQAALATAGDNKRRAGAGGYRGLVNLAKAAIEACCVQHGFTLLALETDEDHVHCFVSAPPRWAPATIVGLLKGYSSRQLRALFPALKKCCGKESLWTSAYYAGTAGAVSAAVIRRYIAECQGK